MYKTYTIDSLPTALYGGTYSTFSFEVFEGVPVGLYFGDSDDVIYYIAGLKPLAKYRSKLLCSIKVMRQPIYDSRNKTNFVFDLFTGYSKKKLRELEEKQRKEEKKDREMCHKAVNFEMFLRTMRLDKENALIPIDKDIEFAKEYYGIEMREV